MFDSVLLFSGGLDSFMAYLYLKNVKGENVKPVYYNIGTKYANEEVEHIKSLPFADEVLFIDKISLGDLECDDAFVPNRNILLATHATSFSNKVWIGGSLSDRVGDNKKEVFDALSDLLTKVNGRLIKISSPFWNSYKCDLTSMIVHSLKLCSASDLVSNTFSCYNPTKRVREIKYSLAGCETKKYSTKECLYCPACFRKGAALFAASIKRPFYNQELIDKYQMDFKNQLHNTPRKLATLSYCSYLQNGA